MTALDDLERLVIVGELEQLVIHAEHTAGHTAATAARPLHLWEQSTSFGLIDDILTAAYEGMARWVTSVRDATVTSLTALLAGVTSPAQVQSRLLAWAQSQPRAVRDAVARAVRGIAAELAGLYRSSSEVLAADAARQGVPGTSAAIVELPDPAMFEPLATAAGLWVPARTIQYVTATGGPSPQTAGEVLDTAKTMPLDGGLDLTRQAAHIVNGQGRLDTAQNLPVPIAAYASELLDSHGCLAPEALITTDRGRVRADQVTMADRLLTHRGCWVRPSRITVSHVNEDLVSVSLVSPVSRQRPVGIGDSTIGRAVDALPVRPAGHCGTTVPADRGGTATFRGLAGEAPDGLPIDPLPTINTLRLTADHPLLVVRDDQLLWIDAGKLTAGDAVVSQEMVESDTEIIPPNLSFRDADDGVSAGRQVISFTEILRRPKRVPVVPVRFDDQPVTDQEINDPRTDLRLTAMGDTPGLEDHAHITFDRSLRAAGYVAASGAIAAPPLPGRHDAELPSAVRAGDSDRGSAAGFRAVGPFPHSAMPEGGSAASTYRRFPAVLTGAFPGAVVVPGGVRCRDGEGDTAPGADLLDLIGGPARVGVLVGNPARVGTVLSPAPGLTDDLLAARQAWPVGMTVPAVLPGQLSGTGSAAAPSRCHPTVHTRSVHKYSVARVSDIHLSRHDGRVYDFTIPDDETFIVGGVVVHNCSPCGAVDGRNYNTLAEALLDYPAMGPYKNCSGGDRCRGTVILIWNTEAPAST